MSDRLEEIRARCSGGYIGAYTGDRNSDPFIYEAVQDLRFLLERIDAALALHVTHHGHPSYDAECVGCGELYPCPTVRALLAENGDES